MTRNEFLDQLIAKVHDVPTLPTTVLRVMQMIEDPLCSTADLARIITADPAMSAKILRLANSAFYGFRQKISNVPQAVTLLGFATLKNALLSAAVFDLFRLSATTGFDMAALWKHSVATATAAKMVAKRVRFPNAEKAFTVGLLHDIGKIMIARYLPTSLTTIVQAVNEEQLAMYDAETRTLGLAHPGFGAWVMSRWNLPTPLIEAVEFHHHPHPCPVFLRPGRYRVSGEHPHAPRRDRQRRRHADAGDGPGDPGLFQSERGGDERAAGLPDVQTLRNRVLRHRCGHGLEVFEILQCTKLTKRQLIDWDRPRQVCGWRSRRRGMT